MSFRNIYCFNYDETYHDFNYVATISLFESIAW